MNNGIARAAALAILGVAALGAGTPPARAAGVNDAWCLIDWEGNSHCYYASSQECLAAVAGGSHGFCNVNPSASSAASSMQAGRRRQP